MTTYYIKKGRRYIPVSEYESDVRNSFPAGTHIVHSEPGKQVTRYSIDPALAPMIAAGFVAEDAIVRVISEKLSYTPTSAPITPAQQKAWENMKQVWGEDLCRLQSGSIMEAVRAGMDEMCKHANTLLENPALQHSYNNFILLSKLTKGK